MQTRAGSSPLARGYYVITIDLSPSGIWLAHMRLLPNTNEEDAPDNSPDEHVSNGDQVYPARACCASDFPSDLKQAAGLEECLHLSARPDEGHLLYGTEVEPFLENVPTTGVPASCITLLAIVANEAIASKGVIVNLWNLAPVTENMSVQVEAHDYRDANKPREGGLHKS